MSSRRLMTRSYSVGDGRSSYQNVDDVTGSSRVSSRSYLSSVRPEHSCSEEDAAIYQASARNSKGIVSCSGVLEVGTMTEYRIHQRFFAMLKLNAEKNSRELEEPNVWDKETHTSPDGQQDWATGQDRAAGEEDLDTCVNDTGDSHIKKQADIMANGSGRDLTNGSDSLEKCSAPHMTKISPAKKKIKISKGEEGGETTDTQAGKGPEGQTGVNEGGRNSVTSCLAECLTMPVDDMEVEFSQMDRGKNMKQTKKAPQNNTVSSMEDVNGQLDEKGQSYSPGFSSKRQTILGTKNQTCSVAKRPCEQSGDQMSAEETSTSLKNVSVSQLPGLRGEEVSVPAWSHMSSWSA
ncbi:hypothetical protein DPEC_G00253660 [Dallia pectoralis]|uniref:Uncharacterized protein n=1 Tax=Dallia pectoralis TaxID=75939 RepID=A0ACC2FU15_DALPE|nr:hypothetical protein DPEC_G00253660 [Dallia pectoralis]